MDHVVDGQASDLCTPPLYPPRQTTRRACHGRGCCTGASHNVETALFGAVSKLNVMCGERQLDEVSSSRSVEEPVAISMVRGLDPSATGTASVSTPRSKVASSLSMST